MIYKAFKYADQTLVDMASVLARAYNSVTGRTRTDLANKLLSAAPIFEVSGTCLIDGRPQAVFYGTLLLGFSHVAQEMNKDQEKREHKMSESNAISANDLAYIERTNLFNSATGIVCLIGGGSIAYFSARNYSKNIIRSIGGMAFGSGFLLRGLSYYVMKTENLPPRKNIFKRITKKISDLKQKLRTPEISTNSLPLEKFAREYL